MMADKIKRCGRVTEKQKLIIVEFMESNPEFNNGRYSNTFTAETEKKLWLQLTDMLNSEGLGPMKDASKWKITWRDMKSGAKERAAKIRSSINKTGGGYAEERPLTELEERILGLMGLSSIYGISGVPESCPAVEEPPAPNNLVVSLDHQYQQVELDKTGAFSLPESGNSDILVQLVSHTSIPTPGSQENNEPLTAIPETPCRQDVQVEVEHNQTAENHNSLNLRKRSLPRIELLETKRAAAILAEKQDKLSEATESIARAINRLCEAQEKRNELKERQLVLEEKKITQQKHTAAVYEKLLSLIVQKNL